MADPLVQALASKRPQQSPSAANRALFQQLLQRPMQQPAPMNGIPPWLAETAVGMLPGAGDVMAMQDSQSAGQRMVDAFRAGDYGGAAGAGLEAVGHGLGALPILPAFGGMVKAYHGSPHKFDKFDMSKIGTGEGGGAPNYVGAFGHGMYFAENPKIAGHYKDTLSQGEELLIDGKAPASPTEFRLAHQLARDPTVLDKQVSSLRETIAMLEDHRDQVSRFGKAKGSPGWGDLGTKWDLADEDYLAQRRQELTSWEKMRGRKIETRPMQGALYNVSLDVEPEDLLDWDAPLSQQSEKVRKALGSVGGTPLEWRSRPQRLMSGESVTMHEYMFGPTGNKLASIQEFSDGHFVAFSTDADGKVGDFKSLSAAKKAIEDLSGQGRDTGRAVYGALAQKLGGDAAASRALAEAGIPGLRYFDAGSRGKGEGSRNVVMFRDDLIKIEGVE